MIRKLFVLGVIVWSSAALAQTMDDVHNQTRDFIDASNRGIAWCERCLGGEADACASAMGMALVAKREVDLLMDVLSATADAGNFRPSSETRSLVALMNLNEKRLQSCGQRATALAKGLR